ncbi:MAG TPA: hypothetical protein DHU81_06585, partial [Hyphomonas sp.]|nr:hypothetical protein [Hyphomonas sp.]
MSTRKMIKPRGCGEDEMLEPAERLEAIKRHFGLSNVELGKVAGVSKQAVNNWFNLNAVPGRDAANKICRKLDISMKWL